MKRLWLFALVATVSLSIPFAIGCGPKETTPLPQPAAEAGEGDAGADDGGAVDADDGDEGDSQTT
ncbi:MAG: hypothetical protein QGG36_14495 [Pirellulaceae bacterium]|jgi:hypothetical protein|nr:hypothetical protein [Pirellulaceae bacterium]MDP7017011.1 hypothetical protein [Pirellulaceae bacterium]